MRPDGAGRLSAGSQLHLGDSEAGLPADAVPRKSVRPVQPQLLAQDKFASHRRRSAAGWRADPDWAKLVACIDQKTPQPAPRPTPPPLFWVYQPSLNLKPRIKDV